MAQTSTSSSRTKKNSQSTDYISDGNQPQKAKKTAVQSASAKSASSAGKGYAKASLSDTAKSSKSGSANKSGSAKASAKNTSLNSSAPNKNGKSAKIGGSQTKHKSENSAAKSTVYDERLTEYRRDSTRLCHQLLPYFFGLLALFLLVCFIMSDSTGWFGEFFRNFFFGLYANAAWTVPFLILNIGLFWRKDVENGTRRLKVCLSVVVLTLVSILLQTIAGDSGTLNPKELFIAGMDKKGGGAVGGLIGNLMLRGFGVTGTAIFTVAFLVLFCIFVCGMTPKSLFLVVRGGIDSLRSQIHDQAEERDIQRETVQIELDQRKLVQRQAMLRQREQRLREERMAANRVGRSDVLIDDLVEQNVSEPVSSIDTLCEADEADSPDDAAPFNDEADGGIVDLPAAQPSDSADNDGHNGGSDNNGMDSFLDQTVFDEIMRRQNEKYQQRGDLTVHEDNPQIVESDAPPFDTGTTASMYEKADKPTANTSDIDVSSSESTVVQTQAADTSTEPNVKEPVRLNFFRREKVRPLPQTETQKLSAIEREETSIDLAEIFKENEKSEPDKPSDGTGVMPSDGKTQTQTDDAFLNETTATLDLIVEKTKLGSHPLDDAATETAKAVEDLPSPDITPVSDDSEVECMKDRLTAMLNRQTSEKSVNIGDTDAVQEESSIAVNEENDAAVNGENEALPLNTDQRDAVMTDDDTDDDLPDDDEPPFDLDSSSKAATVTVKKEPPVYVFPPIPLLSYNPVPPNEDMSEEIRQTADKLGDTLRSFNVKTKIVNVSIGPTVTRYELQPEIGTKVRSIVNLVDDIALHLATSGVRIEAPIPGKEAVGIEVPNKTASTVYIRELIEEEAFKNAASRVTACLGMDVGGNPVYLDVAKMPHLLIAGTTGSGKSVCINSLIISILYKARPDEVKFILIDPKKVELNPYNGIPHLLVPVVSDAKKAAGALHWAVSEMERRYELIEGAGVRNVKGYNQSVANDPDAEKLPQIVIIIDELADLMMMAKDDVEEAICRIAQKARAAGMHLIIGTQRPSVDVITGLIKANVPSRIAFTTMSQVDSRTIIDIAGAEKLIGRGDMLYSPIGALKPIRVQGSFVSDDEVEAVTGFIKQNCGVREYDQNVINTIEKEAQLCGNKKATVIGDGDVEDNDGDPMLKAAISLAVESGKISTSLIQRRLQLGYGRAAKLIDMMQDMGIVGPPQGQKPRDVLISKQEFMEMELRRSE